MSVIVDLSIFPVDKGDGVSSYVAEALKIIEKSGVSYRLGPMGTCLEGEWDDVMAVIRHCFDNLRQQSDRIYMTMKIDYRKGREGRISGKVRSVEGKMKIG